MFALLAAAVLHTPPGREVAAILAAYRSFFAFASKGNAAGMTGLTTSDFTQVQKSGRILSRAQTEKEYAAFFRTFRNAHFQWKVSTVRVIGTNGSSVLTYTMTGQSLDSSRKLHPIRIDGKEEHTWRKEGATWKQRSSKVVSERVFLDGKPMR